LPGGRALPLILIALDVIGAAMLAYFFAVTTGPRSPVVVVALFAMLAVAYAAARGLSARTVFSVADGTFRCTSPTLWPVNTDEIALVEIAGFEGRAPAHTKDVAHVVVRLQGGGEVRLTTVVADASMFGATELAQAVARELDAMIDDARRRGRGYRIATSVVPAADAPADGEDDAADSESSEPGPRRPARRT
jgi:hypothetical protein